MNSSDDDVGIRLRRLRERAGLSQRQLAKRAGVANGTISLIESGSSNPSVAALKRILAAVPIDMATFFSSDLASEERTVYRADELVEIGKGGISYRLVGAGREECVIQMLHEVFAPGADSGRVMIQHKGEECGVVVRGRLELWVGDQKRTLKAGDAYYFSSTIPHRFRNPDHEHECEIVSACSPPDF